MMNLDTYEVNLYGEWERSGQGAAAFIDYVKDDTYFNTDYPRRGWKLIDAEITQQERSNEDSWYYNRIVKERGTVHVRLDVSADNGQMALKKAKTKITRWLNDNTCEAPKITWL